MLSFRFGTILLYRPEVDVLWADVEFEYAGGWCDTGDMMLGCIYHRMIITTLTVGN